MKRQTLTQNNSRVALYAIMITIILGIGFVIVQDITVPTEHISQNIEVNLDK